MNSGVFRLLSGCFRSREPKDRGENSSSQASKIPTKKVKNPSPQPSPEGRGSKNILQIEMNTHGNTKQQKTGGVANKTEYSLRE